MLCNFRVVGSQSEMCRACDTQRSLGSSIMCYASKTPRAGMKGWGRSYMEMEQAITIPSLVPSFHTHIRVPRARAVKWQPHFAACPERCMPLVCRVPFLDPPLPYLEALACLQEKLCQKRFSSADDVIDLVKPAFVSSQTTHRMISRGDCV